jgi:hypothetical protein
MRGLLRQIPTRVGVIVVFALAFFAFKAAIGPERAAAQALPWHGTIVGSVRG